MNRSSNNNSNNNNNNNNNDNDYYSVCLYCSTVEASSDCKTSVTYMRSTNQQCYVLSIIPATSAKFFHLHF